MRFSDTTTTLPRQFRRTGTVLCVVLFYLFVVPVHGHTAETIVAVKTELPADPGKVGRNTLAGIDANSNGVRDDVERYIGTHFGNDEKAMRLVANLTIAIQYGIIATTERESSKAHSLLLRAQECSVAAAIIFQPYGTALKQIEPMEFNTSQRKKAWATHIDRIKNLNFAAQISPEWDEGCLKRVDEAYQPGGMNFMPPRT